jgi:predicted ribosome-associated RNA-binding protein Tma20
VAPAWGLAVIGQAPSPTIQLHRKYGRDERKVAVDGGASKFNFVKF